jgi:hypothetical protein
VDADDGAGSGGGGRTGTVIMINDFGWTSVASDQDGRRFKGGRTGRGSTLVTRSRG